MADESATSARAESAKIIVHWLERSRAQRLLWLLEECKVPYDVKVYKRIDNLAPPEMKQVHPLGKSPILTIETPGQSEPLVMAESGAIFEYFVDHYAPHLAPRRYKDGQEGEICGETESWLRYRYYMHYSEGSFMSLLMCKHTLDGIRGADVSSVDAILNNNFKTHLAFLESQISSPPDGGKYLCGKDLTAADIMMCFPLQVLQSSAGIAEYPKLDAYVERLTSRSAYEESVEEAEDVSGEKYYLV